MPRHLAYFVAIVAAASLAISAWAGLRASLEARMAASAQRGLETIVDLVSAELTQIANASVTLQDARALEFMAAQRPEFMTALREVEENHFRHVYFFDPQGRTLTITGDPVTAPATEIVRLAGSAVGGTERSLRGTLFEPYADGNRQDVIGVWRWLPKVGLGVVAERPYARFIQPLHWFDAAFAALIALLAAGAMILARRHLGDIGAARESARCGPYDIVRRLGDGSMSNVYLARHRYLRREVALKRLKPHAQSDELCARFEREARLASQLAHPNIVTVLDHGRAPGGGFYYAMEYIEGLTLTRWVEGDGPLPPERAIHVLDQICAAVGAMHAHHLMHRDIKPDNIMAYAAHGEYDLVKLLDFGLIRNLDQDASRDLTRDVRILGTPAYMAPERLIDPRRVDVRSDLYSIACVGFFLLTGRKPFEASQDGDLVQQVLHIEAPRLGGLAPSEPPADLDALIAESLAKDPGDRPDSIALFRARLRQIAATCPWSPSVARAWWREREHCVNAPGTRASLDASLT
jgi:serine/threonine-protein kinase